MARSRNIKPGIVLNDALAGLAHWVRLLFIYLWTIADRDGRLEDNPRRIGAALFPYEADLPFDDGLQQLHEAGFIKRYAVEMPRHASAIPELATEKPERAVEKTGYIQIVNWAKHQNPHPKEIKSDIPEPLTSNELATEKPWLVREKPERARLIPSSLIPDSPLPHTGIAANANSLQEFLAGYPKQVKLDNAGRAYVATITTDQDHAALMAGLKRWKASSQWVGSLEADGGRFIPDPDKFIFERRYLEHPTPGVVERPTPKPSSTGIDPKAQWIAPWKIKKDDAA